MSAHLLSFDVEDWFHSLNLQPALDRSKWNDYELRVVQNTHRILDLLAKHDTKATFFILGHVADRAPELVQEIDERGHEVASHGYNHELLYDQSVDEVRNDLRRSKELLDSVIAGSVTGYRAPSFSITESALETLSELGFEYDSSHFPVKFHDRYGDINVTSAETVTSTDVGLTEVQLPSLDFLRIQIPWAGGGYFRVIPYWIYRRGIEQISTHRDFVFYLHPWELDSEQPRFDEIPYNYRLRHYTNLEKTEARLDRLLTDFDWEPIGTYI